jgi:hypothetical protein
MSWIALASMSASKSCWSSSSVGRGFLIGSSSVGFRVRREAWEVSGGGPGRGEGGELLPGRHGPEESHHRTPCWKERQNDNALDRFLNSCSSRAVTALTSSVPSGLGDGRAAAVGWESRRRGQEERASRAARKRTGRRWAGRLDFGDHRERPSEVDWDGSSRGVDCVGERATSEGFCGEAEMGTWTGQRAAEGSAKGDRGQRMQQDKQ